MIQSLIKTSGLWSNDFDKMVSQEISKTTTLTPWIDQQIADLCEKHLIANKNLHINISCANIEKHLNVVLGGAGATTGTLSKNTFRNRLQRKMKKIDGHDRIHYEVCRSNESTKMLIWDKNTKETLLSTTHIPTRLPQKKKRTSTKETSSSAASTEMIYVDVSMYQTMLDEINK